VLLSPKLAGVRSEYERVIRQRNALLKSAGPQRRAGGKLDLRTLDVWDAKAATCGGRLIAERMRLVQALRPHLEHAYQQVSAGQGEARMLYRSSLAHSSGTTSDPLAEEDLTDAAVVEARLLEAMARLREKEMDRG